MYINPCFHRLFIQFSKTLLAVQWILNQLESSTNLQYWNFAIGSHMGVFLSNLIISSQIQLFSRFYSQHANLYESANLFVYSFLHSTPFQHIFSFQYWFHCCKLISVFMIYHIFIDNLCRLSVLLPFCCHVLIYICFDRIVCSPVSKGRVLILCFVKIYLYLLNAGLLNYAESYLTA